MLGVSGVSSLPNSPKPIRGALMLAYDQEEYIAWSLRSIAGKVDAVVVAYSAVPWTAYNRSARAEFATPDATHSILVGLQAELTNVTILEGVWHDEESMRNDALHLLRRLGVSSFLIVDADEFYDCHVTDDVFRLLEADERPDVVAWARYRNLYRSFRYEISGASLRLPVAGKADGGGLFLKRRILHGPRLILPSHIYYWHTGYVLGDARMLKKIRTFGHAHEIATDWYAQKWLAWTPETRDLDRVHPIRWPGTCPIDPLEVPSTLHSHPFFPDGASQGSQDKS
jgi:hypothetical protein